MIDRVPIVLTVSLLLFGCNDISMTRQKRYGTFTRASIFKDGTEAQRLPDGVVAQGDLERQTQGERPPPIDAALLARGRERYDIYCSPCHGFSGKGDGMVVQRGFPAPPSYHVSRLRAAPAQHFFDVISNGYGAMYAYAARVEPRDRWAIVAYIRALQESQHASVADAPEVGSKLR